MKKFLFGWVIGFVLGVYSLLTFLIHDEQMRGFIADTISRKIAGSLYGKEGLRRTPRRISYGPYSKGYPTYKRSPIGHSSSSLEKSEKRTIHVKYDDSSSEWTKDAKTNRLKLNAIENYSNHVLQARGFIFLNDIYQSLGLDKTSEGQRIGWILGGDGEGYVDFGIKENDDLNDPVIRLEFNPDGDILDQIDDISKARLTKDNQNA